MKSTQAMRDRCRELSNTERDDYDRAVVCVLDDLEALLKSGAAQGPDLEAIALSFVSIIQDGRAQEASAKTIASLLINELLLRRALAYPVAVKQPTSPSVDGETQEKIEHWQFGYWQDVDDSLPPIGERVVASDGNRIWLDMRHEMMPTLGWGSAKALYWLPFERLAQFLTERKRQEQAAKRAAEEPDVIF